eukprot:sb/3470608/
MLSLTESLLNEIWDMSSLQESPSPEKREKRGTPPEKRGTPPSSLVRHQATPRTPLNRSHLTSPISRSNKLGCKRRLLDSPLSTSSPLRMEKKSLSELFQNHLPDVAASPTPLPVICEREMENQAPVVISSPPSSKTLLPYNSDQYPGSLFGLDPVHWATFPLTTETLARMRRTFGMYKTRSFYVSRPETGLNLATRWSQGW